MSKDEATARQLKIIAASIDITMKQVLAAIDVLKEGLADVGENTRKLREIAQQAETGRKSSR